jgi:hypothetical protein
VELTKVVGRAAPFHRTTEDDTKLVPVTVRVNPGPPRSVRVGLSAFSDGTGFRTDSVKAFDATVLGDETEMLRVPARAMSAAGMVAVSLVTDTKVVGRALPLTRTTAVGSKFVPFTVSMKSDPPPPIWLGLMLVSVGIGETWASRTRTQSVLPGPLALLPGVVNVREPEFANGDPAIVANVPLAGSYQ